MSYVSHLYTRPMGSSSSSTVQYKLGSTCEGYLLLKLREKKKRSEAPCPGKTEETRSWNEGQSRNHQPRQKQQFDMCWAVCLTLWTTHHLPPFPPPSVLGRSQRLCRLSTIDYRLRTIDISSWIHHSSLSLSLSLSVHVYVYLYVYLSMYVRSYVCVVYVYMYVYTFVQGYALVYVYLYVQVYLDTNSIQRYLDLHCTVYMSHCT